MGTTYLARRLRATPFVHPNPSCDLYLWWCWLSFDGDGGYLSIQTLPAINIFGCLDDLFDNDGVHPNSSCDILGGSKDQWRSTWKFRWEGEWYLPPNKIFQIIRICRFCSYLGIICTIQLKISNDKNRVFSHLDIILATPSRPSSSGAVVLLVDVPRTLFRSAIQPSLSLSLLSLFHYSIIIIS